MSEERILGQVQKVSVPNCTQMNFPLRSFYSKVTKDVYTFYRQGHGITVNSLDTSEFEVQKLPLQDMDSTYLIFDEALMTRSSDSIVFYKLCVHDKDSQEKHWKEYHRLKKMRGQIYFIKGNVRI
jgi:hypothetical protein